MNQKYKHKSICIVLSLLFLTFPVICMQLDQPDQEPSQQKNRKRKRKIDEATPAKKQKREFDQDEVLYLLLYKEASKCEDYDKLSDASLAFLLEFGIPDMKQIVAEEVYAEQIDPFFIAKLLCDRNTKPKRIWTHLTPPHIEYGNNSAFLKCDNPRECSAKHKFHISHPSDIHVEEKNRLRKHLYHAWDYVKTASKKNKLTAPTLVIRETNGDLVTAHENNEVHRWSIGKQFDQNKEMFALKFNLQEVLLLKHMQKTQDPIDIDKEKLGNQASKDTIDQLQTKIKGIPRKLRLIRREKQKEKADNEEV